MSDFYIVRFIRADGGPDEEYYYNYEKGAADHFDLFLDDDSEIYDRIELEHNEAIIKVNVFIQKPAS